MHLNLSPNQTVRNMQLLADQNQKSRRNLRNRQNLTTTGAENGRTKFLHTLIGYRRACTGFSASTHKKW